ncbi:hypothetical protein D3C81_527440 [compost metagenome]
MDGARRRLQLTGDGLDQFGLAVAFDTGNAQDFTLADRELDRFQQIVAVLSLERQVFDSKYRLSIFMPLFLIFQHDISSDHQAGNFLLRNILNAEDAFRSATAHNRNPVAYSLDFLKLMGDKDDGMSGLLKLLQLLEELYRLLRRQHSRRLVKN